MSKQLKQIVSRDLDSKIGGADGFVAVDFTGLNSEETFDLRKTLRESGAAMHVVPNRLARRVLEPKLPTLDDGSGDGSDALKALFRGPTAIVISQGEGGDVVISSAKAVSRWGEKNKDKLAIKGGLLDGKILSIGDVEDLAKIPDSKALQAQFASLLQAPLRNLAVATQQIVSRVVYALQAYKDKLDEQGGDSGGKETGGDAGGDAGGDP